MKTKENRIVNAEMHATAMMKRGRMPPISIRKSAKLFSVNEYDLAKKMNIQLDLFSFKK